MKNDVQKISGVGSLKEIDFTDVNMVIMVGVSGSGKSYWAKKIAEEMGAEVVSSDSTRKELFSSNRYDPAGDEVIEEMVKNYYPHMYDNAIKMVNGGGKVIVDATNLKGHRNKSWRQIRSNKNIRAIIVVVRVNRTIMGERMKLVEGMATENESYYEAWSRVVGYHDKHLESGEYEWPSEKDGFKIYEVWNN